MSDDVSSLDISHARNDHYHRSPSDQTYFDGKKMKNERESYAKEFIESVRRFGRCEWCGRNARKNRKGLCRPCNGVRKHLDAVEKQGRERPSGSEDFTLNWELRVAREMKNDCIAWGRMLEHILNAPSEPLSLEHWFRRVAENVARDKTMHYGMASTLASVFAPAQRQVLAYLFWEVFSAAASHNRQNRAMGRAHRENLKVARGE